MPKQYIPVPQSRCISEEEQIEEASSSEIGGDTEQIEEDSFHEFGGHNLTEHIIEKSFYELDRSKLPPRTPTLLRYAIRVVMVTVKIKESVNESVIVRYPSIKSLEAHFVNPRACPDMDEKFTMGSRLAAEALVRRIPSCEVTKNSSSNAFWFDKTSRTQMPPLPLTVSASKPAVVESKFGNTLRTLLQSGPSWSSCKFVSYVRNVEKDSGLSLSHSSLAVVPKIQIQEDEESTDIIKCEAEEIKEIAAKTPMSKKRKGKGCLKRENDAQNKDGDNIRWKLPRYESAKNELLAVMKAKEASYQNPIPRKELREAARKHIGDTGLLDHLLLHVVDKLAPGGTERFRRRCDPLGLTEYWLESADMMDIRKKAGVLDPYWNPPSGWKLGDPICNCRSNSAAAIRSIKEKYDELLKEAARREQELKEEVVQMRGEMGKYDEWLKEKARREQELMEKC